MVNRNIELNDIENDGLFSLRPDDLLSVRRRLLLLILSSFFKEHSFSSLIWNLLRLLNGKRKVEQSDDDLILNEVESKKSRIEEKNMFLGDLQVNNKYLK